MESRFFDILTDGVVDNSTAVEGVVKEYSDNAVVKLPGIADRLNDIETFMYANASEAISASLLDLERYIKLLALESYNDISIKAMESRSDYPAEILKTMTGNTLANSINYSLRLIENIHSELADNVRDALEGYLYLIAKGAKLDMQTTMNSITESLHVVLESVIEAQLSEIEYEENPVVGMEAAIIHATSDITDEDHVDLVASMTEMCESLYDAACENLIRLEGNENTLFDMAMEDMLTNKDYTDKNTIDDLKSKISSIKSKARTYKSELLKLQTDLDIERSRNNNLRVSNRLEKKKTKVRYNVDGDVKSIDEKLAKLNQLDPKNPDHQDEIRSLVDEIESTYTTAKSNAETSRSKETDIVEGARNRQLKKASRQTFGENVRDAANWAMKKYSDVKGNVIDRSIERARQKVDQDLKAGKITKEEAEVKYKQIEEKEKRGVKSKEKTSQFADKHTKLNNARKAELKAGRDKIIADGGKLYRDKDLVEKDIEEANKQDRKKSKSTPKKETQAGTQNPPANKAAKAEKKVELVDPKDKSLFAENWGSLSASQKKTITTLRRNYITAYNEFKKANPSDSAYGNIKNTYETSLNLLRRKLEEVSNKRDENTAAPEKTQTKKQTKRNKGKSDFVESLSGPDRQNYNNLLNNMTQLSNNKKALEDKKDRTPEEDKKLAEVREKLDQARTKYNSFVKRHQEMTEAVASVTRSLYENIDVLQYAINEGYSIYDMRNMTTEAFESFISDIEDQVYEDCYCVAMEAVKERESRKEKKAREAAEKEAARKAKEEAIRKERSDARDKVIAYANEKIEALKTLRTDIGRKWSLYSNDVKNLTERADAGNLRGLRYARSRNIVKNSVGGGKYDFKKYSALIKELDDVEKELKTFIESKEFYDQYDKTDKPEKDYKAAVKKINNIVDELIKKATKKETEIESVGKNLDKNSVVQHERDDKAAYSAKQKEEAQKKDKKDNPDKYKLKETKSEHEQHAKDRDALIKKQEKERAKKFGTTSPAEVSPAGESMELPVCVNSIEDFEAEVECSLLDLRETLIDPEIFFNEPLNGDCAN